MRIRQVTAVYFSAVGNTKKAVLTIAGHLGKKLSEEQDIRIIDFTLPKAREEDYVFSEDELVVFGTPVYAGRIPNKILPFVQTLFEGNGALAVPVVTFGNRSYQDALMELCLELEGHGFKTVAAAAVVATHVMSDSLAAGRPNEDDQKQLQQFAETIIGKLEETNAADQPLTHQMSELVGGNDPVGPYYRPLEENLEPANFLKAKPKTKTDICDRCGICADVCPMGSIDREEPETVKAICIKCQACIRKCPKHAKYFDDPSLLSHIRMLEKNYNERKETELFL